MHMSLSLCASTQGQRKSADPGGSGQAGALQSPMSGQEEKRRLAHPHFPHQQGEAALRGLGLGGWQQLGLGVPLALHLFLLLFFDN